MFTNPRNKQTEDYVTGRFGLRWKDTVERRFDQQLDELKQDLLKMSGAVEESIGQAVRALVDRDDELVQVP